MAPVHRSLSGAKDSEEELEKEMRTNEELEQMMVPWQWGSVPRL